MTQRAKFWKFLLCFAVLTGGSKLPAPGQTAPAGIGAASDQAAAHALDLMNNGKLPDAEQAYMQLISQYPTAGVVPEALFRLGYVQYLQQEYNPAIDTLNRIVSPPATPAIKAAGDALIPQVMAAEAGAMSPGDPSRKKAFDDAIAKFDDFIKKYPQSQEVESAIYGRAMAAYENQDYEAAEKSLHDNLQRFPNSDSLLDNEDLLAVALMAEANSLIESHGNEEAATVKFKDALGFLADIIERRSDVVLANDAQFQIGEVLFDRSNAEQGAKKTEDLTHAIDGYRAVQPQEGMVQAQQARVTDALQAVRQLGGRPGAALEEAQRRLDRESAKLASVQKAPDQTMNAQLRIAACYFLLGKYDESRVLLRYLQPFADQPDQKKQIQYYMVLTYASQGIMDKATAAYRDFETTYKGDPLGENLPLVIGSALLSGTNSNPRAAVEYLNQERELYPSSPLVNEALNEQAAALVRQHEYGDAIATYQQFLATKPSRDQAATAEQGIAAIYQQTGKLPDAVKQYQKIADTYTGSPVAEECGFYAAALEASVDLKQALPMLQAFVSKFPDGKYTPQAMMMIGEVQATQGNTAAAMETYKDLAAKFPKSNFAQQADFQQASILARDGKTADMVALLQDFIKTYPDSKDIYYAYDTIGQTQVAKGQIADAISTYSDMARDHEDNPMAATALYRTAELWRQTAASMGRFAGLHDEQVPAWKKGVDSSISAAESVLDKYPKSEQVGLSLKTLVADQQMLLDAKLTGRDDIDKYFHGLAEKFASDPSAKSRILFTLAAFTYQTDPSAGMGGMTAAYDPSLVYAPTDMDLYGSALMARGRTEDAYKVYQKLGQDYPVPANATPAQATPAVQEAQATSLFGMATALDKEGKTADAGKLFAELKKDYPWSPKVLEANFGIAKSLVDQQKYDDASKLLVGIVSSHTATAPLRANAFLLIGDIQAAKNNVAAAIDSYLKTAAFYAGVPDAASEGLWRGGQMLEKQSTTLTEQSSPKKSEQVAKAVKAYKDLISKYPDSPRVPQAQDRLRALAAQ
jgi:TolA-binding protein